MTMRARSVPFETSRGNVFADLGFARPDEELVKAQLLWQIGQVVTRRGLKQVEAARVLGIPQSKASLILRGRATGFSTGRLLRLLNRLDQDIEIVVRAKAPGRRAARVSVVSRPVRAAGRRARRMRAVS